MSRIVEGIKELLKGKDDDELEPRYRYEKRQSSGSSKRHGYPASASAELRNGYPAEGRSSGYPVTVTTVGRNGYPVTVTSDGRGGYPANSIADGRSGYPASPIADGRSGYPASPVADGRSGYPASPIADGRSGYPANSITDGRSGYPANPIAEGRSAQPVYATADGRNGYGVNGIGDGRSGYPVTATADARSAYPANSVADGRSAYPANSIADVRGGYAANATEGGYRKPFRQALDDDYVRSTSYDTRTEARGEYRKPYESSSPRGPEYRQPYGVGEASPRAGFEYGLSPRSGVSPRGEYVTTPQQSPREYRKSSGGSVIEFMVPMGYDNSKEKVQEALSEVDGVETIRCDVKNSRVIVTGDKFIDIDRCLTKLERAVKKRCELISNQPDVVGTKKPASYSGYYEAVEKSGILSPPVVSSRPSPSSRPGLVRMPSFASGKVTPYDVVGPRGQDYEAKDYNGFRRMPSFSKHRHHEAEYITGFDERPEPSPSARREFAAPIRRMPSFNRHRHHDAEYISADDRDYSPRSFYETGSSYTSAYNDRPNLLSQVSFSEIPVENPQYVKHVAIGSSF